MSMVICKNLIRDFNVKYNIDFSHLVDECIRNRYYFYGIYIDMRIERTFNYINWIGVYSHGGKEALSLPDTKELIKLFERLFPVGTLKTIHINIIDYYILLVGEELNIKLTPKCSQLIRRANLNIDTHEITTRASREIPYTQETEYVHSTIMQLLINMNKIICHES